VSRALLDAMDSVLPVSGLGISAVAVPFRGEKAGAELLVSLAVDGRDITFRPGDGRSAGGLEVALGTMSSRGEQGASQHELVQLPLEERSRATVSAFGLRIVRKVAVAPGRHQLRVGVLDRPTGRVGVVHLDILLPDYRKAPFDISGILLTSSLAGRVPTARGGPLEQLQRLLPGPPALTREFRIGEDLALYAEIYGNAARLPGFAVVASVLDEGGREVQRQDQPPDDAGERRDADVGRGSADPVAVRRMIPLRDLGPGHYLLRLEARTGSGKPQTTRREVPFSIVP
jgi:hypothetical protein